MCTLYTGCDATIGCLGKMCVPLLVGSGSWSLLALAGCNWLQRRRCTKNLLVLWLPALFNVCV